MRPTVVLAAAGVLVAVAACGDFNVPNKDEPSINALTDDPTLAIVQATAIGLQWALRDATDDKIQTPAHYGREGYYLAVARTALTEFDDPLSPSSPGGLGWSDSYVAVNTANALRAALDALGPEVTTAEKEAVRGFAKTIEAAILHSQLRMQGQVGIVVDTDRDASAGLAPIVTEAEAFTYILTKYNEGMTHLMAGGGLFPFEVTSGFDGFNTPTPFIAFNRAMKARAALEAGDNTAALDALTASFLDDSPGADLDLGVWNVYSTASGDETNNFFDPAGFEYLADTNLVGDALINPITMLVDARLTRKTAPTPPLALNNVTSDLKFTLYNTNTAPIPVIRNEELILIRAEARLRTSDLPGALADVNYVRVNSGGLEAITPAAWGAMTMAAQIDEILYNRRYSLMFEFGHRWVDLRRTGRLLTLEGPRGAGDRIYEYVPIQDDECDARKNVAPRGGCSPHHGIPGGTKF